MRFRRSSGVRSSPGLVGDAETVPQHVVADLLDVLRRDVAAPLEERLRPGRPRQKDRAARARR